MPPPLFSIIFIMIRPAVQSSSLLFFTMLLFVAGDLYFAHTDNSCAHSSIVNTKIGFTLATWLKISGYTNLLFLLFPVVRYCIASCSPPLLVAYMVFAALYVFFRFIWLVLGGIMFWGHLWKSPLCSHHLSIYMWINLVYSSLILMFLCYNQQQVYTTTYVSKQTVI